MPLVDGNLGAVKQTGMMELARGNVRLKAIYHYVFKKARYEKIIAIPSRLYFLDLQLHLQCGCVNACTYVHANPNARGCLASCDDFPHGCIFLHTRANSGATDDYWRAFYHSRTR